jgi:hypothetical protein
MLPAASAAIDRHIHATIAITNEHNRSNRNYCQDVSADFHPKLTYSLATNPITIRLVFIVVAITHRAFDLSFPFTFNVFLFQERFFLFLSRFGETLGNSQRRRGRESTCCPGAVLSCVRYLHTTSSVAAKR